MIYGHIATGERIKQEHSSATDDEITAYLRGDTHRAYEWARNTSREYGHAYDLGFEGKEFKPEGGEE